MSSAFPLPVATSEPIAPVQLAQHESGRSIVPGVAHRLRSQIVIPARLASTRLSQKLLLAETGKPLLQHTFESASLATRQAGIAIAVDSPQLASAAALFGAETVMTDPALASGTDRVAAVAKTMPEIDVFVNVQGDEPEMCAAAVDQVIDLLEANPHAAVATLACPIRERCRLDDPSYVKVVCDETGRALYFSRSAIPHVRDWDEVLLTAEPPLFLQHLGIYAYRRDLLMRLDELPASPLEQSEKLEQLRFLQAGYQIVVGQIDHAPKGIDTQADYDAFVARYRNSVQS